MPTPKSAQTATPKALFRRLQLKQSKSSVNEAVMPVPFEALIPFGLLTVCFAATGTLFSVAKRATNDWKPPRYNVDAWDAMMMERDRRLTGSLRGQSTEPVAPKAFATNSIWQTERIS